jgi:hypothetical protein
LFLGGGLKMLDTISELKDIMFHIVIYLFLWRILSELSDIKECLKRKDNDVNDD